MHVFSANDDAASSVQITSGPGQSTEPTAISGNSQSLRLSGDWSVNLTAPHAWPRVVFPHRLGRASPPARPVRALASHHVNFQYSTYRRASLSLPLPPQESHTGQIYDLAPWWRDGCRGCRGCRSEPSGRQTTGGTVRGIVTGVKNGTLGTRYRGPLSLFFSFSPRFPPWHSQPPLPCLLSRSRCVPEPHTPQPRALLFPHHMATHPQCQPALAPFKTSAASPKTCPSTLCYFPMPL
jgi:hypothetical protein